MSRPKPVKFGEFYVDDQRENDLNTFLDSMIFKLQSIKNKSAFKINLKLTIGKIKIMNW